MSVVAHVISIHARHGEIVCHKAGRIRSLKEFLNTHFFERNRLRCFKPANSLVAHRPLGQASGQRAIWLGCNFQDVEEFS